MSLFSLVPLLLLISASVNAQIPTIVSSGGIANSAYQRGGTTNSATTSGLTNANIVNKAWDQGNTIQWKTNSATLASGVGPDGSPASASGGQQLDRQSTVFSRGALQSEHLDSSSNAANYLSGAVQQGATTTKTSARSALGPFASAGTQTINRQAASATDTIQAGRDSSANMAVDHQLTSFDNGALKSNAASAALVQQGGGVNAAGEYVPLTSTGVEQGAMDYQRTTGIGNANRLVQGGQTMNVLQKTHNGGTAVDALTGAAAYGPYGASGYQSAVKGTTFDNQKLQHVDQVGYSLGAYDNLGQVTKAHGSAAVQSQVAIGGVDPVLGSPVAASRVNTGANMVDTVYGHDVGNQLNTNAVSSTLNSFNTGGRTVIGVNGVAIGRPPIV